MIHNMHFNVSIILSNTYNIIDLTILSLKEKTFQSVLTLFLFVFIFLSLDDSLIHAQDFIKLIIGKKKKNINIIYLFLKLLLS